jgi:hypothetical protein
MPHLRYRIVSACGELGGGFPREALRDAIRHGADAIAADAGSMHAAPAYLATGTARFSRDSVKEDYLHLVRAGLSADCPVIVGSCGSAGGDRNLDWMLNIAREVFAELTLWDVTVGVIRAQVDNESVINAFHAGDLREMGSLPRLSEQVLRDSTIVAEMGVHPIITALNAGARFIFAGRVCEASLFAADMIRRDVDAGVAYHVGRILAGGALACEPASAADCLVAEIYDDGSAIFRAPSAHRHCTPLSLALHCLRGEIYPHLHFYPEGALVTDRTQYFASDRRSAGLRSSEFLRTQKPWPLSVRLEGARARDEVFEWSIHHRLRMGLTFRQALFPITYYRAIGADWTLLGHEPPKYFSMGTEDHTGMRTDAMASLIADAPPSAAERGSRCLRDMCTTIRAEAVGTDRISIDVIFASVEGYEAALRSNLFFADNLAAVLGLSAGQVIGSYYVDACHVIKISIARSCTACGTGDNDVVIARQLERLDRLRVPIS